MWQLFAVLATYVNDLNPVILEITDSIKLRWYGFAYLLAFMAGYLLLKWMGDRKLWVLPGKVAGDFIAYTAFFGVFLGGRIGNVLIYQRAEFFDDPLMVFRVWEGGMASHGGLAGVMLFALFYARKHKVSWTGVGDGISVVAPLGLMFGRLANFINGELYGRIDRAHAWAMKFPDALGDDIRSKENVIEAQRNLFSDIDAINPELARTIDPNIWVADKIQYGYFSDEALESDKILDAITPYLEPRYPSQLFQAAGEGLSLFLILYIIRIKFPRLAHGILTGLFFIFYAIFRIAMENFREPEISDVNFLGFDLTMGQYLSLFMVLIGIGFVIYGLIMKKGLDPDDSHSRSS